MANERPSVHWLGLNALGPGMLRNRIQTVLSTTNFRQLEKVALAARLQQDNIADPSIVCTVNPYRFTNGFNNVIFELEFSDSVYWIARIQHVSVDFFEAHENAADLLSEITTMRTVRKRTSIPVPEVYTYDVSPSNEVGYPYLLMESLPGRVLQGPIALQVPPEHTPKVAKQLAEVMFQLHGLAFDRLGRLWSGNEGEGELEIVPIGFDNATSPDAGPRTSLEWFYTHRQQANRQALESHPEDPEWLAACWVLKTAVPHIIIEARLRGPFPLCHLDLHHGNLLFDDDYNLTGVIDWSQAQTVPLERLVVSPEFVTFPAGSEENNKKIIGFKELVREHLQHLEEAGRDPIQSSEASQPFLSQFFGSRHAEITHRCTYSRPHRALWDARLVAALIYGDQVSWTQLVSVYRGMELY
ncbi:kinase-like domain-containing protein [Chaetomium fimeti]|uniref:Kinase-like domain-containing protein n=1 Tax=Chaetomium fimeti TaxID=1854472 RepID=A0AAE0HC04_9PEZI|nr:kinase-like domain-containing protein [Chaetomium fimeti]